MSTEEISDVQAAARQLLEKDMQARLDIIERLVADQQAVDDLAARLAEAEQRHARDYAEAERLGWAPQELRKLKLRAPSRRSPGRPSRGKSTVGPTRSSGSAPAPRNEQIPAEPAGQETPGEPSAFYTA